MPINPYQFLTVLLISLILIILGYLHFTAGNDRR